MSKGSGAVRRARERRHSARALLTCERRSRSASCWCAADRLAQRRLRLEEAVAADDRQRFCRGLLGDPSGELALELPKSGDLRERVLVAVEGEQGDERLAVIELDRGVANAFRLERVEGAEQRLDGVLDVGDVLGLHLDANHGDAHCWYHRLSFACCWFQNR
jgi:hypothetical protein